MNELLVKELAEQAENYAAEQNDKFGVSYKKTYNQKLAELIYKDIITVVAAQALMNESALDVFANLERIYKGAKNEVVDFFFRQR